MLEQRTQIPPAGNVDDTFLISWCCLASTVTQRKMVTSNRQAKM